MVQGSKKLGSRPGIAKKGNSAKSTKKAQKAKLARKGNPTTLSIGKIRYDTKEDLLLSKEIAKASEQKVAVKLIQAGGKAHTKDIMEKGKELSKEQNRSRLKKKVGRVEQKLKLLEQKESQ